MVAGLVGIVVVALTGAGLIAAGRAITSGELNPNMGHMNVHNTTPHSWREMQATVGRSLVSCGRVWLVAAAATLLFVPVGVALVVLSTGVLVVQLAMAATRLVPAES